MSEDPDGSFWIAPNSDESPASMRGSVACNRCFPPQTWSHKCSPHLELARAKGEKRTGATFALDGARSRILAIGHSCRL